MEARGKTTPMTQWLPKLIPFLATAVYFIVFQADHLTTSSVVVAFWKCCPIVSLIYFVLGQKEKSSKKLKTSKSLLSYRASIAIGLALGCIGDVCLVFQDTYFIHGMLAFAVGHAFYIYAAGFKPIQWKLGIGLFTISGILLYVIRDNAPDPLIRDAMPVYSLFLVTMLWRALARMDSSFPRKAGAFGGVMFIISDFILVLNLQEKMQYGDLIVITTYYMSQLGTALSVLDSSAGPKQQ